MLTFSVSDGAGGSHLARGDGDIPTSGSADTIYRDIKRGVYGNVVQCTWGLKSNTVERAVTLESAPLRSRVLKIVVIDPRIEPGWNFVAVSDMTLARNQPEGEVLGEIAQQAVELLRSRRARPRAAPRRRRAEALHA